MDTHIDCPDHGPQEIICVNDRLAEHQCIECRIRVLLKKQYGKTS